METLFIESQGAQLYSNLHLAQPNLARHHNILLCAPVLHEHDVSYWALKQVALRLQRQGFNVLRFDYYATGNSEGKSSDFSIERCLVDTTQAYQFIQDETGIKTLSVVGLRLGCAIAWRALRSQPVGQWLLWEPLIDGRDYLNQVAELHRSFCRARPHSIATPVDHEAFGYAYPPHLTQEFNSVAIAPIDFASEEVSVLTGADSNTENWPATTDVKASQTPFNWHDHRAYDAPFLPNQCLQQITAWSQQV